MGYPLERCIRLIALDLDGTTLSKDGHVSHHVIQALDKARRSGIEFTFATGRAWRGLVEHLVQELEIRVPVVTMNGGDVRDVHGGILAQFPMSTADVQTLMDVAVRYGVGFWAGTPDGGVKSDEFPSELISKTWLKFGMYTDGESLVLSEIRRHLEKLGSFEITNSHSHNIEINPAGVHKAKGLEVVCSEIGISSQEVMVVGDSLNDVPMMQWAGLSVAMGNAQPQVKTIARYTTESVEEDGVAHAIERMLEREWSV